MPDNTKETQKDVKSIRTERLKPFRFTSANQPANRGRKKGRSPTDWLKKLAHTKVPFLNPLTGKDEAGEINLVVAIQLILKATQDSDLASIREYFDRVDGKVTQVIETPHTPAIQVFVTNLIQKAGIDDAKGTVPQSDREGQSRSGSIPAHNPD